MLNAPFLELSYFVGESDLEASIDALRSIVAITGAAPKFGAPGVIGIAGPEEMVVLRGGVIEFRTEGEVFCGPAKQPKPLARSLGQIAFQRFLSFADFLRPKYGALLVEYSLETPEELRKDPRSLAFRDFYLAKSALTAQAWEQLHGHLAGKAYVQAMAHGSYISMTPYFNPDGKGIPSVDAQMISSRVATLLVSSMVRR